MLFNSIHFLIFYPIIFIFYWFFTNRNLKIQNLLLLVSSFYFYACWDWRFLFLLLFTIFLDYFSGIMMSNSKNIIQKRIWFYTSILVNVGFLGFFKYYNFFITSFCEFLSSFGFYINTWTLKIILPIGISFYTFHGLSYVIDIYYGRIKAERNFVDYAVFVSFFPLLVAGPIERATHLLPQIKKERIFNYNQAVSGLKLIIWGFFKKVVVADNLAFFANQIYESPSEKSSLELFIGAIFFSFQIYCDFSGYSDIAMGTARLFGIELLKNFRFPYFSIDIPDFWKRWHISLTSWFRDYLYIPLGGSRGSKFMQVRNVFIVFLVSGFWHGANWTFIFWGFLNALFFLPSLLFAKKDYFNINYNLKTYIKIILTFIFVSFIWIFFRSDSITIAFEYLFKMFSFESFSLGVFQKTSKHLLLFILSLISVLTLILIEYFNFKNKEQEVKLSKIILFVLIGMIFFMGSFKNQINFIYFQF
jgi:alginate O-acetyltransferase complex protein AlgI